MLRYVNRDRQRNKKAHAKKDLLKSIFKKPKNKWIKINTINPSYAANLERSGNMSVMDKALSQAHASIKQQMRQEILWLFYVH